MKQIISNLKTNFPKKRIEKEFPYASSILLALILTIVFILPIFPKLYFTYFHNALINGIFIAAVFSIKRNHVLLVAAAIILSITIWISLLADIEILTQISRIIQFFFFVFLVGSLIAQVSRIESVTLEVIIDAVTGYFLLGFAFNVIVTSLSIWIPSAYTVPFVCTTVDNMHTTVQNNIYYTFITFTTTGYGDILPNHPIAKSLAVLISVSGQLYIATIIAMLVGKYVSSGTQNKQN